MPPIEYPDILQYLQSVRVRELSNIAGPPRGGARNTCTVTGDPKQTTFTQVTEADALQAEALRLIKM